jgi:hypothetical protein
MKKQWQGPGGRPLQDNANMDHAIRGGPLLKMEKWNATVPDKRTPSYIPVVKEGAFSSGNELSSAKTE